jgi:hypothetical protein
MAPKKKAAKKGNGDDDGPDVGEMNMILTVQVENLKMRLVMEQERANISERINEDMAEAKDEKNEERDVNNENTQMLVSKLTTNYQDMERDL